MPAYVHRTEIEDALENMCTDRAPPFLVLTGRAGCGKSTQLPQFVVEKGLGAPRPGQRVLVIEPNVTVARQLALRVAHEWGCKPRKPKGDEATAPGVTNQFALRGEVQCQAGSWRQENPDNAAIVFRVASDLVCEVGQSLAASATAPFMAEYGTIILDEAHERLAEVDALLGMLVRGARLRLGSAGAYPPLRLIVTSATINVDLVVEKLGGCPHVFIPVYPFPVTENFVNPML